ncbi:flavin reductase family protein [Actinacidiphila bryophytorum]|uniref:NADH-FMN oxidoreductase RutF, flavin reductase (DIM6/NTAB) family n=1 Tax=Actinacidiphila bryophytorum TaxID=1436133 RepID=A0A9W4E4D5_9ACTN|nr:flavin reductase family protein [Actinacidiphila bryophytorum]MBM9438940.1 flavin reductase family protein [Actinacidiphila bryophytorum]MBN6547693.1 flavin reductase family protein [Actinacidiphila bryophytorum]CAG7616329.1 NADH-FMN oxidoreductase RutF, flavin reductase (DIM6/NTAB) family [Actinacidiphila bryophytorum]
MTSPNTTTLDHTRIEPGILYFGTPVVLLSTANEDGTPNLAPMSSAFWLGWRCMLGLGARSQTAHNLLREREVVLNLPDDRLADAVDRLALTTGRNPVPGGKAERGYRYEGDKFGRAGLTPLPSQTVRPPRAAECPVAMEAVVEATHPLAEDDPDQRGGIIVFEVRVQRVLVHDGIRLPGSTDRIDPDRWRPLIMSFQQLYGLGPRVRESTLARIPEGMYRGPDIARSRVAGAGRGALDTRQ